MKKLSIIFSAVLLLLFFSSTVMAQNNGKGNDNKSVVTTENWGGYWQPVICEGVTVDNLSGTVFLRVVSHHKGGEIIKRNVTIHGEATSLNESHEVFKILEHDVELWEEFFVEGIIHWRFNLKGNMGSHYIGYYTFGSPNFEIKVEKILCK